MTVTIEDTCNTCIFFKNDRCKRNPPQITQIRPTHQGIIQVNDWPQVLDTDWCGCHNNGSAKVVLESYS